MWNPYSIEAIKKNNKVTIYSIKPPLARLYKHCFIRHIFLNLITNRYYIFPHPFRSSPNDAVARKLANFTDCSLIEYFECRYDHNYSILNYTYCSKKKTKRLFQWEYSTSNLLKKLDLLQFKIHYNIMPLGYYMKLKSLLKNNGKLIWGKLKILR